MGLYDSPVYRSSQQLTETLLGIARLNQHRQQMELEEQARLRAEDRADRSYVHDLAKQRRDDLLNNATAEEFRKGREMNVSAAPPDPTGSAPLLRPGGGMTPADMQPKGVDAWSLAELFAQGGKLLDTQAQPFLQQGGIVQPPEAIKLAAQRADASATQPDREAALATMGLTPEQAKGRSRISAEDLGRMLLGDTRQQNAETQAARLAFDKARENLETVMSQLRADKVRADTGYTIERTKSEAPLTYARVKSLVSGANLYDERAETERGMRPEKIIGQTLTNEGKTLGNKEKRLEQPFIVQKAQADLEHTRAQTKKLGEPGAGKAPTELSLALGSARDKILSFRPIAQKPSFLGFGGSPAQTIEEQVEDAKTGAKTTKERLALEEAYRLLLREGWDPDTGEMPTGGQVGTTAPAASMPKTATGPNGQKLILRNGQWVPLGR